MGYSKFDLGEVTVKIKEYTPSERASLQPFYAHSYSHFIATKKYFTTREGFDSYLIMLTIKGAGKLSYNGGEFILEKGKIAFIDCEKFQHYQSYSNENWEFYWIHIDKKNSVLSYNYLFDTKFYLIDDNENGAKHIFEEIFALKIKNTTIFEMKMSFLISSLLLSLTSKDFEVYNSQNYYKIKNAVSYIKENYRSEICIDELCRLTHFSKYRFLHVFKQVMGESPYKYVTRTRINEAKRLLNLGESVNKVSEMVGYKDVNTFIRSFKNLVQLTPSKYNRF